MRWWPLPANPITALAVRCYCTFGGFPGEATLFRGARSGTEQWAIRARSNGRIGVYSDGAWRVAGTDFSIPADGSLVRVEAVVNGTNITLTCYAGHSTTVLYTGSTAAGLSGGVDEVWFGKASGSQVSTTLTFDDLAVANTAALIGPSESALATPDDFDLVAAPAPTVGLTATWDPVAGATGYELEVQRDNAGSWVSFLTNPAAVSPVVLTSADGLVAGTTYRARVRALP